MARTHINFRSGAALVLLAVLVVLFASLGNWQLDRAAQRDAIHAQIEHAARIPPATLGPRTPDSDMIVWRRAQAHGRWLHHYTVLLQNRNYQARPGYWVATPLQIAPGGNGPAGKAAAGDTDGGTLAVLVLRGWLARDDVTLPAASGAAHIDPALNDKLARTADDITVSGQLFPHVPRLFELWSWSDADGAQLPDRLSGMPQELPTVQNLDLDDYAHATGLELLPVVLAQTNSEPPMIQDWPHPSSDSDTNRGYALQWFSFCIIAAGAWLFIAWRTLIRSRQSPP